MENKIVVRSDYWKCQLSVKRKLHIPVSVEEVMFAYKTEFDKITNSVVIVFDDVFDKVKVACEAMIDATYEWLDDFSSKLKPLVDMLNDLVIDQDYYDRPVLKVKGNINQISIKKSKVASKSAMRQLNMSNVRKPNVHCRNRLRK